MNWRYVPFGTHSGEYNMSLDRQLFEELQSGARQAPVLRFYCWDKPTVSLGINQQADSAVNVASLERLGYGLVKRPTGGRALLHKGDLCYAIIADRNSHPDFHSLTSTYRAIGEAISATLDALGVQPTALPATGSSSRELLSPCFAMINPFEVSVRGRKICGSAQFRSGDFFLQHGSLRVRDNWSEADLADLWPQTFRIDATQITSLECELKKPIPAEVVLDAFLACVRQRFAIESVGN